MRLDGKIAVITGGASGIGRGIALCMAREGANIIIPELNLEGAQQVADEAKAMGREALAVKTDVTKRADVEAMVKQSLDTFAQIDILVNNAGIFGKRAGMPFLNNEEEDWDQILAVNIKSHFIICKAIAPHMMERRYGKIINIASIAGKMGSQSSPPYTVSKAGVISFTQVLAKDLAPFNINVNAICPGLLWTPLWEGLGVAAAQVSSRFAGMTPRQVFEQRVKEWVPMGREQTPEDIGHLAVFLASEEARNITGQAINVDGGIVMH
jgi:NAD(P)-dependent dehydrogenase (short-subunit alcohol dehydrogenase family)